MELLITSLPEAIEAVATLGVKIKAIISIADSEPYTNAAPSGMSKIPNRLRLIFDDTQNPNSAWVAPTNLVIKKIIDFAHKIKDINGICLVHCEAGISRSTAAALILQTVWSGAGNEASDLQTIYKIRDISMPNKLMISLADDILGRSGLLMSALMQQPDALFV